MAAARMFDRDAPPLHRPPVCTSISPAGSATRTRWQAIEWKRAAAPAHGERSGGDSGWDRSQRAASAPPLAPGDYVLALARPKDLALLDRVFPFLLRAGGVGRVARAQMHRARSRGTEGSNPAPIQRRVTRETAIPKHQPVSAG